MLRFGVGLLYIFCKCLDYVFNCEINLDFCLFFCYNTRTNTTKEMFFFKLKKKFIYNNLCLDANTKASDCFFIYTLPKSKRYHCGTGNQCGGTVWNPTAQCREKRLNWQKHLIYRHTSSLTLKYTIYLSTDICTYGLSVI